MRMKTAIHITTDTAWQQRALIIIIIIIIIILIALGSRDEWVSRV